MKPLIQGLRVFEAVSERQPIGVSELARALALPKATVQRALVALGDAGWLRRTPGPAPRWVVTQHAMVVGMLGSGGSALRELALPAMEELRAATRETIHLAVPEDDGLVVVERIEGPRGDRAIEPIGRRVPYHATATGKAVLAHLAPELRRQRLRESLQQHGTRVAFEPATFALELDRVRALGYSAVDREWRPDVGAVGAPILTARGEPIGAISVSAPAERMTAAARRRCGALVAAAGRELSARLRRRMADAS
jgi:IclR family transcriptional regulator, acetate operon repressor